jgi:hypothetical protein
MNSSTGAVTRSSTQILSASDYRKLTERMYVPRPLQMRVTHRSASEKIQSSLMRSMATSGHAWPSPVMLEPGSRAWQQSWPSHVPGQSTPMCMHSCCWACWVAILLVGHSRGAFQGPGSMPELRQAGSAVSCAYTCCAWLVVHEMVCGLVPMCGSFLHLNNMQEEVGSAEQNPAVMPYSTGSARSTERAVTASHHHLCCGLVA